MTRLTIQALAVAWLPCIAAASTAPPPAHPDQSRGQALSLKQPLASLKMGALNVRFEETTLSAVRDAIKAGAIAHQGDAGASEYWLCYSAGAGVKTQRVWIIADGAMGGGDHRVTGVRAQHAAGEASDGDCPQLPARFLPLQLDRGLWLGKTAQGGDGWTIYGHAAKRGKFDVTSELAVQASAGKVSALSAFRITSD